MEGSSENEIVRKRNVEVVVKLREKKPQGSSRFWVVLALLLLDLFGMTYPAAEDSFGRSTSGQSGRFLSVHSREGAWSP